MTTSTQRSVYFLRHGERIDFENPDWAKTAERYVEFKNYQDPIRILTDHENQIYRYDPELSSMGLKQADEAGKRFKNENRRVKYIFCSPYIRCLQTVYPIAEALDLPIRVEHGLCEWFGDETPLTPSHEPLDTKTLKQRFPRVDENYESRLKVLSGESELDLHFRGLALFNRLLKEYVFGENNSSLLFYNKIVPEKHTYQEMDLPFEITSEETGSILVVTHAATVIAATRAVIALTDPEKKSSTYFMKGGRGRRLVPNCGVCSLSKFSFDLIKTSHQNDANPHAHPHNHVIGPNNEQQDTIQDVSLRKIDDWIIELDGDVTHMAPLNCKKYYNWHMPVDAENKPANFYL